MEPIEYVRALITEIYNSPAYEPGSISKILQPYKPIEKLTPEQLRPVWRLLNNEKERLEIIAKMRSDRKEYLSSFSLNGFDEPCIYNNFGAD